jgi:hypothetical protein
MGCLTKACPCPEEREGLCLGHLREREALAKSRYADIEQRRPASAPVKPIPRKAIKRLRKPKKQHLHKQKAHMGTSEIVNLQRTCNRLRRICRVLFIEQMRALATKLGHSPSYKELRVAGIDGHSVSFLFGTIWAALRQAGFPNRPHGTELK